MRSISVAALGSLVLALSIADAAFAGESHHARKTQNGEIAAGNSNVRNSRAEWTSNRVQIAPANDARLLGSAMSAPAGH